ncbi:hypothetical protein DERF_003891 [Dermatophagoides farinae]|uniref:Superoxide dismutase copper/zinc binding domain-containing protein n=1 Tax=Dermatophagoides farinae TaxID=6954 RepID=A0A922LCS0_DERFA|nr:hypothetical protein DERF_003891 [Dermatophagoides farinae]
MMMTMMVFNCIFLLLISGLYVDGFLLYSPIDSGGIRGNVTFSQQTDDPENVHISVYLYSPSAQETQQFDWAIHEFPVFFDLKNPCQATELGKSLYDLSRHGRITIPSSGSQTLSFIDKNIHLKGPQTIWGRSIYLKSTNTSARACSNIMSTNKSKMAIATFTENVAGSILFRENEFQETMIFSNLFYNIDDYRSGSRNDWKIMVTDILDSNDNTKCNQLQILLDPDNTPDSTCSMNDQRDCKIGDMLAKHGQIVVGNNNNRYSKKFFIDMHLPLDYLESSRNLFVVIYWKNSNKIMTCAKITPLLSKEVRAHFDADGVKGDIMFKQNYKIDPTIVTIKLDNLRGRGRYYFIHEFPIIQKQTKNDDLCGQVGDRYNPFNIESQQASTMIQDTNDQYEVGDLSGKHGTLSEIQDIQAYFNSHMDFNLPLFGVHSVVGRSIVIHKANGKKWICANIAYPGGKTIVAKAIFYYPIVGSIVFRQQDNGDPFAATTVFGELFYSDGSANITRNHPWRVHVNHVGMDFYNWTKRCMSCGENYNPFSITTTAGRSYQSQCSLENQLRCQVGDLFLKYRKIDINHYSSNESTRFFYTDTLLPLSGKHSILARSIVIEDENAPQIRGKRMACATIRQSHPITAIVDEWRSSAGISANITGRIEMHQESVFDETKIKIIFASVPLDKEFPCSGDILYGHYNPFEIDSQIGPLPSIGSVDEYETGDLSGKFGINSVIGRSIVIHREENNFRWTCATIKPKVAKNEREIIAIASFDDPRNLIQGYIRFRQIEYWDGSLSDTWIETYLAYRGSNKKTTYGHKWSVYVNQVGADAYNQIDSVRCLAGGFLWNPFLVSIDKSYKHECNPKHPLRCALGDISGRHEPLVIGGDRRIYSDVNLPLVGNNSIINRALVISMQNQSDTSLACTNIKLDKHLLSTIVVQKVPAFTVAKFMHHMRLKLNTTEWLVVPEIQKAKEMNNDECIQIMVHFYGDEAWKLQSEFNNLIEYGSIRRPNNGELIKTYYKSCKTALLHSSSSSSTINTSVQLSVLIITTLILTVFLFQL